MAHLLTGDAKYRDLTYDDGYRSDLITRRNSPSDYRFGRTHERRVPIQTRTALSRVNGFFKNMIEAIANAKLQRMERELELGGIRFGRSKAQPARSRASK